MLMFLPSAAFPDTFGSFKLQLLFVEADSLSL